MNKVMLRLDDLEVQSFATTRGGAVRGGTVRGHAYTDPDCTLADCPTHQPTCGALPVSFDPGCEGLRGYDSGPDSQLEPCCV